MSTLPNIKASDYAPALAGSDYGELFLEDSHGLSIRFEDSRVENIATGRERGLGLRHLKRVNADVETYFGSCNTLEPADALRLHQNLLGPAASAKAAALGPLALRRHLVRLDPSAVPVAQKVALLNRINSVVRSEFTSIRQVTLSYGERQREIAVLNSAGDYRIEVITAVMLSISVVAAQGPTLQTGSETIGGRRGYELFLDADPVDAARTAARRALAKLASPKARAGEMSVVLSSAAGGTFIHEAIGHSLEVDHVQEGSSPAYHGKLGAIIAPENITVVDDPTLPFYRGSFAFDDEGVAAAPTTLVKNGKLVDYLYDRVTALREDKRSNGHGRRESFQCRPIPRMSNLYIAPGTDDPAEILRSLKKGIYVTRMGGGQVNTATGEFVFEIDEGFWVEDGKIQHMIRDANMLGVGPDVLRSIDRVGWDIGWGMGTCGKDGQGVPVGDGQPTIRMPKILIGGAHD